MINKYKLNTLIQDKINSICYWQQCREDLNKYKVMYEENNGTPSLVLEVLADNTGFGICSLQVYQQFFSSFEKLLGDNPGWVYDSWIEYLEEGWDYGDTFEVDKTWLRGYAITSKIEDDKVYQDKLKRVQQASQRREDAVDALSKYIEENCNE